MTDNVESKGRVDANDFGVNYFQEKVESNRNESDLKNSNESECDNECYENYSRENQPDTNRSSNSNEQEYDGNRCGEMGEDNVEDKQGENELDISTSHLLPLINVNTNDYNPNTSFSEYIRGKSNILQTGNIMTNTAFRSDHDHPRREYLDLSTGQINVVDGDGCYEHPPKSDESAEVMALIRISSLKMLRHTYNAKSCLCQKRIL